MYIAMNRFQVKKDRCGDFERMWRERDSYLHEVPGFKTFHLLKGPEEDDFVLYSSHAIWESQDHFVDWTKSEAFRKAHGIADAATLLCVVPGSRNSEVRRMLPVFAEAVALLADRYPDLQIVIPVAPNVAEAVEAQTKDWPLPVLHVTEPAERFDAFAASDAAMAKSGTVTLELGLARVPMAVAYRVSALTAFIVRRMPIAVKYASLVNLLADREVVPELIQEECTAEAVADSVGHLLGSADARAAQQAGFDDVLRILGDADPPPSKRAAKVVLDLIENGKTVSAT